VANPITQKITTAADTEIVTSGGLSMMTLANTTGAAITVDLYIEADTISSSIADTDLIEDTDSEVDEAGGYRTTGASRQVDISNGGTAATSDVFLNKAVYKNDGTLIGICTTFTSAASITFGAGILVDLDDDLDLYVASKNYIIKNVSIPSGATLRLEADEISFDRDQFSLWINCSATGIDVITRN
jgi:hypothetical protein